MYRGCWWENSQWRWNCAYKDKTTIDESEEREEEKQGSLRMTFTKIVSSAKGLTKCYLVRMQQSDFLSLATNINIRLWYWLILVGSKTIINLTFYIPFYKTKYLAKRYNFLLPVGGDSKDVEPGYDTERVFWSWSSIVHWLKNVTFTDHLWPCPLVTENSFHHQFVYVYKHVQFKDDW